MAEQNPPEVAVLFALLSERNSLRDKIASLQSCLSDSEVAYAAMKQRARVAESERDFYKVQYLNAVGELPSAPTASGALHPKQTSGV